jgi:hypothetical protein
LEKIHFNEYALISGTKQSRQADMAGEQTWQVSRNGRWADMWADMAGGLTWQVGRHGRWADKSGRLTWQVG